MNIKEVTQLFKNEKVQNTKIAPHAIEDFINKHIKITQYTSFQTKREIAQTIVDKNITVVDGYKVVDSPSQFLSFVITMIVTHTDLTVEEPYSDYDALCEVGLLQPIITMFQQDYGECETVLKMVVNDELQTNTTPAIIAQFLDKISEKLGDFSGVLKEKLSELDLGKVLGGAGITEDNLANILSVLDKEK